MWIRSQGFTADLRLLKHKKAVSNSIENRKVLALGKTLNVRIQIILFRQAD